MNKYTHTHDYLQVNHKKNSEQLTISRELCITLIYILHSYFIQVTIM